MIVRLAIVALPEAHRLKGPYKIVVIGVCMVTCVFGVLGGLGGLF